MRVVPARPTSASRSRSWSRDTALEVHRERRVTLPAVAARHLAQILQQRSLRMPRRAAFLDARRRAVRLEMEGSVFRGTEPMAVRTEDVALGQLGLETRRSSRAGPEP